MSFSWKKVYCVTLFIAFVLALPGLKNRYDQEGQHRSSSIIVDWSEVKLLGGLDRSKEEVVLSTLVDSGARGMIVEELTGEALERKALPLWYGDVSDLPESLKKKVPSHFSGTALVIESKEFLPLALNFIKKRFSNSTVLESSGRKIILLPFDPDDLIDQGILPDLKGLAVAKKLAVPVIYRPAPWSLGNADSLAQSVAYVCDLYPNIVGLAPSGEVVSAYPDLKPLASLVKKRDLFVAQVEFSRQIGAKKLQWSVWPRLLSLHSVTEEEVLARHIDRKTMTDRMVRASLERSVSLLLFRIDPLNNGGLKSYSKDIGLLRRKLAEFGIDDRWPTHIQNWSSPPTGALAMALVFVLLSFSLFKRIFGDSLQSRFYGKHLLSALLFAFALAIGALKIGLVAKLLGAFTTAWIVSEATLMALENWRKPGRALVLAPLVAVVGGLSVASFFSAPLYMMRMIPFSGVKITLFLPILIVLFHDLHRRVHPESLGEILTRPPLWGELFLCAFLMGAAAFMLFRSGNVSSVAGWEIKMREILEKLLVARPRTKEVFLGYPCLFLWFFFRKKDLAPSYREIFRLGTTVAFASLVNSFCHFHTRLYFILWRVFNGWACGVFLGILVLLFFNLLVYPMWRRYRDRVMS